MKQLELIKPAEIAQKYKISLKTVYNYLKKFQNEIQTIKQDQKTLVNFKDFQNVFDRENTPKSENPDFMRYEFKIQSLQSALNDYNQLIIAYKSDNEELKKGYERKIENLELQKEWLVTTNIKTLKKFYLSLAFSLCLVVAIFFLIFDFNH